MSSLDVPGHSDHMGSEGWRIQIVSLLESNYEGCGEH
jgi:hypothetical protein